MTEAQLVREIYPRHTMKLLARLMEVPVDTARHWLFRRFPPARRRELALKLLAELAEKDRRDAETRQRLEAIAHGGQSVEVGGAGAGEAAGDDAVPTPRPPAGKVGS